MKPMKTPVRMLKQFRIFYPGDLCGFSADLAAELIEEGIAEPDSRFPVEEAKMIDKSVENRMIDGPPVAKDPEKKPRTRKPRKPRTRAGTRARKK